MTPVRSLSLLIALSCIKLSFAQTIFPDGYGEPESQALMYLQNSGQLQSDNQLLADAIDFYSWGSPTPMFFKDSEYYVTGAEYDAANNAQTLHRMDFKFTNGANTVVPRLLTPQALDFRYYTQNGSFTSLGVGKRIVYEDVYQDVDCHFYSNEFGSKMSVVFENGADPSVFEMQVNGYDDITTAFNNTTITKGDYSYIIPKGIAYEVDAEGGVIPLSWQVGYQEDGNGRLSFGSLGTWNTSNTLIFQFGYPPGTRDENPAYVDWCTLFGGGSNETYILDLKTDQNGALYAGGNTTSANFPSSNTVVQEDLAGMKDLIFAKFDVNHALEWATFIGGSELDGGFDPFRFDINSNSNLLIASETKSTDFPTVDPGGGSYYDGVNTCGGSGPCDDGVILELSSAGNLIYSTYFGLAGQGDRLRALVVDDNDNFYVVGSCSGPGQNPGGGAYFSSGGYGRIVKFNSDRSIHWSTAVQGNNTNIFDCALDANGDLLITGYTGDYLNFPIQSLSGAYNQTISNGGTWEGFVAQFDVSDHSLKWSTFIGGSDSDRPWDIDVSDDNEVIVSGHTLSSMNFPTTSTGSGFYQSSYGGSGTVALYRGDGFLARFGSDRSLELLTYVGDNSSDDIRDATFHHNYILATGITASAGNFPFPAFNPSDMYVESQHNEANDHHTDGFVMAIRNSDLEHYWSTYLGSFGSSQPYSSVGHAEDDFFAVEPYGLNKLYVAGAVFSTLNVPFQNPGGNAWFQSTHNSNAEGLICLFDLADAPLNIDEKAETRINVFPNPTTDILIIDGHSTESLMVSVKDIMGRTVLEMQPYQSFVDVSAFEPGSYIISIQSQSALHISVFQKH